MSKSLKLLALSVVLFTSRTTVMGDGHDLFSDVRTNSVFEDSSNNSNSGDSPRRITRAEELREMLKSSGFEAKVVSNRIVTTQKELAPWTFPVMVELSEDETRVTVVLGLKSVSDVSKELPTAKLLEMMKVSQKNAPALFAYHPGRERTEVSSALKNQGLTGLELRDEVNRLAILAKKYDTMWSGEQEKTQESQPPQTQTPQTQTPQTQTPPSPPQQNNSPTSTSRLVGRWSAARSATEAFAVEFTSSQTFNLVYVNNGRQTRSSGKFTVGNGSLSMTTSDGTQITGSLTVNSDTQFTLTIRNSTPLVFRKAS